MHVYPTTLGITGQVFQSGKHFLHNNVADLTTYLPSVDNLSYNVKEVNSTFVVPVYGHRDDESDSEEELYPQLADSASENEDDLGGTFGKSKQAKQALIAKKQVLRKPAAIFQFINKRSGKPINELDIAKMSAISPLLGLAIDNVAELHSVINVRLGVAQKISKSINLSQNGAVESH